MQFLPAPLALMGSFRQFICYVLSPSKTKPGKMDKFPVDYRTGQVPAKGGGGAHDRTIWTGASEACEAATRFGPRYGVGFVFTDEDPFFFLDIDGALDAAGQWSPLATHLCTTFAGAAIEVSTSGRGLHIIGTGAAPLHGCKNTPLGLEFYTSGRFVALTGTGAVGDAGHDCAYLLPWLVENYFPPAGTAADAGVLLSDGPVPEWRGPEDDALLLSRALKSVSAAGAFGGKATFAQIFDADVDALTKHFPDPDGYREYDASSADAALAAHLAFWTGKDGVRIERLMKQSKLVRDKWEREDYLPRTICAAVARQNDVLIDKPAELPTPMAIDGEDDAPKPATVTGNVWLSVTEQQNELFKGCVYVSSVDRVLVPGGRLIRPATFRVEFGGYMLQMDSNNEKTTRDAFEAWTQNLSYRRPLATGTCFRPALPTGRITEEAGQKLVNTWYPISVPRKVGDMTRFNDHMRKLFPLERDRLIVLSYMAAVVQHKGIKFQWAPLIQGVEGNGKTLLTRCVAEAVGERYTHMPPAHEIHEKFNAWLFEKIFIGVEDIYVPEQKKEIFEILKPMITSGRLAKRAMQTDQVMHEVCCNFIFNSNHQDAVRKTRNDRRIAIFYCAQQNAADLVRDGMHGDYFPKLYEWLREEGYAIVSEFLHTFPIPDEFNPATSCQRAPETSSTEHAIHAGMGTVEQEIIEATEQGLPGFAGGWISSLALDRLLEKINATRRVPPNKRRDLLAGIGYQWHPHLPHGRTLTQVMPDNGKPRLYVTANHPCIALTDPAEIAAAYTAAQTQASVFAK